MVSDAGRRNVLAAAVLGSSLAPFMVSALVVALPAIADEFSADAFSLGWVTSAFFISAAVFLVPLGRIADLHGPKKVFLAGLGVYLASSVLCILAPSLYLLVAARFVTGLGGGMIFGTSIALLSLAFPESERGRAIGINVTGMFVGFLLGFLLGGLLTFYVGWRSIFLATIPVEILAMGLILLRVKGECALSRSRELDLPGLVLYSLSILLLMVGFSSLPRIAGSAFVAGGGLTLGLFILRERRTEKPAVDLRLFTKNPVFARASLTALLFNTSNFAVIFLLSLYLQDIRGFDARYSGTVLLTLVIFMALFSPYAGRLSDRRAPRAVIGTGIILSTAGLLVLLSLGEDSPLSAIVIALAIMGTGFALFQSPLLRTLVSSVPRDRYGLASGFAETMRLVGMTVSIAIATLVFGFTIGGVHVSPEIAPAFIAAMRLIFGIFLGFSLAALAVSLLLKRGSADPESRA
ncbi:MAG TPA: MFS transporter [Methanomicrobiales archaeon]|nr:MFS transporter [Methanomicrobiales archaeon]